MLNVGVMVSGGGTNLQAILDAVDNGAITNAQIRVVISNNPGAYALERAKNHGIEAVCISPKSYETRDGFNEAFLAKVDEYDLDLIVLAGFLVAIPEAMTRKYEGKIINIHPSLIPSFCGKGYYGPEGSRGGFKARREGDRGHGAFCGQRYGYRPYHTSRRQWKCRPAIRRKCFSGG